MPRKKNVSKKKTESTKSNAPKKRRARQFQTVRGMRDLLPQDQPYWQRIRRAVERIANDYNYQRIDTPVIEFRKLFERGTGSATDIVEKEMFKFKTRGRS